MTARRFDLDCSDDRAPGAQRLVVAVFQLAVQDALGGSIAHSLAARQFLASPWAEYLAAMSGVPLVEVQRRVARATTAHVRESGAVRNPRFPCGPPAAVKRRRGVRTTDGARVRS